MQSIIHAVALEISAKWNIIYFELFEFNILVVEMKDAHQAVLFDA